MKKIKWLYLMFIFVVLVSSCNQSEEKKPDVKLPSSDGSISVMAPFGWTATDLGVKKAIVQASGDNKKKYLMIVREKKTETQEVITFDEYNKRILKEYEGQYINENEKKEYLVVKTVDDKINKKNAKVHTIISKKDGVSLGTYLIAVDSEDAYYQIILWTEYSRFDFLTEEFMKIAKSFKVK